MNRTNPTRKKKLESLTDDVRSNVRACHSHLSQDFINSLPFGTLLSWCHPLYREDYARKGRLLHLN